MIEIFKHNCIIGEGPIWRESDGRLYFVNPVKAKEICSVNPDGSEPRRISLSHGASAIAFCEDGKILISSYDGVFLLDERSGSMELLCHVRRGNDGKVGPDGRFYFGTQSSRRSGEGDDLDGKLYRLDSDGELTVLLDGLILSNGMDWSSDGKKFYHTDSDTHIIKEYDFDISTGSISYTGRSCLVDGVDGFTIDTSEVIYAACWGKGHIAKIDTRDMKICGYIETPVPIPSSCGFFGKNLDMLAITTADWQELGHSNPKSGYTFALKTETQGKAPYIFGKTIKK